LVHTNPAGKTTRLKAVPVLADGTKVVLLCQSGSNLLRSKHRWTGLTP